MNTKRLSALSAILTIVLLAVSSIAFASPRPVQVSHSESTNLAVKIISSDGTPVAGQPATFHVLVVNEGTNGMQDVHWQAFGTNGNEVYEVVNEVIPYLAAQSEQTLEFEYAFGPEVSGNVQLFFMLDPQNSIEESNEQDNRADISLNVAPARPTTQEPSREDPQDPQDPRREQPREMPTPVPGADVLVNSIFIAPGSDDGKIISGKTTMVRVIIENKGDAPLELVDWQFFAHPSEFDTSNDPSHPVTLAVMNYAKTGQEENLHPGELRIINFEYAFEAVQSEDFTVEFTVDPFNKISEANEDNNVQSIRVHIDPATRELATRGEDGAGGRQRAERDEQRSVPERVPDRTQPTTPSSDSSTVTTPTTSTTSSPSTSTSSSSSSKKKKSKTNIDDDKESAKDEFYSKETLKKQFLTELMNKFSKDKTAASATGTSSPAKNNVVEVVYAEMPDYIEFTEHVCKFKLFGWCLWGKDIKVKVPVPKMVAPQTFYV